MATDSQKRKAAAQTGVYLVIITAVVILANLLSAGLFMRKDMTATERFTLSQGSGRLINGLNEAVQADVYVATGVPQLDAFVRDLKHLLAEYEAAGNGKFKYTIIEPKTDEQKEKAREAGLQEQPFGQRDEKGDGAKITQGFLGIVLKYGSEESVIPALHPGRGDGLEFMITNEIREIKDKNDDIKHRIGLITGKEEIKLGNTDLVPRQQASFQAIITQNWSFYNLEDVDLGGGAAPIDPELEGLIITQPGTDFTEDELRRIDEFLMLGGKALVVMASAVNIKANDATMNAELNLHNLDTLLTGYGIEMHKDAVLDHGGQIRIPLPVGMGKIGWARHPAVVHVVDDPRFEDDEARLDTSFPAFFRMPDIMMPFPSSLSLLRDKQPESVTLKALARTTPAASLETGETVDLSLRGEWQPKPPFDQRIIAATAEGPLKSAFAGKPSENIQAPEQAKSASRVLVVSSAQFITNPFARAGNPPPMPPQMQQFGGGMPGDETLLRVAGPYTQFLERTIFSLKGTLDWMGGDADLIASSAKLMGEPNLSYDSISKPEFKADDSEEEARKKDEEYNEARKQTQDRVQWSLTLGLPFIFALLGLWRWQTRNKRVNTPIRKAPVTKKASPKNEKKEAA